MFGTMEFPPYLSLLMCVIAAGAWSTVSTEQLSCEQLCLLRENAPPNCACHPDSTMADNLNDLQQILKKAAPHNKIFKWGRKRSIDEGALDNSDASYAPQEVQRRIFRWGKRSAPQNQIFRWGKKRAGGNLMLERSPSYGDITSLDVLRLEQAIREGRMDYYDVLAGSDVPIGKRRNMSPEMQNHIFKWGR